MSLRNSDSEMGKRMETSWQRAIAAINEGASGKKSKPDPLLENAMNGKAFNGVGQGKFNKSTGGTEFRYNQKPGPGSYKMTRTFFGIKNPWLGAKTYVADKADLSTKSGIANVDRKFTDKQAKTSEFYQADKKAAKQEDLRIKTGNFIAQGETQGAFSQVNESIGKEMTIDQVRNLLNKERKASASANP